MKISALKNDVCTVKTEGSFLLQKQFTGGGNVVKKWDGDTETWTYEGITKAQYDVLVAVVEAHNEWQGLKNPEAGKPIKVDKKTAAPKSKRQIANEENSDAIKPAADPVMEMLNKINGNVEALTATVAVHGKEIATLKKTGKK